MKKPLFLLVSVFLAVTAAAMEADDLKNAYPLSFTYDGQAFSASTWSSSEKKTGPFETETSYTSPDGKLRLTVSYKTYPDFPVTEVRPYLECISPEGTGIIDGFRSLDLSRKYGSRSIKVRRTTGSMSTYTDFCRHDVLLQKRSGCNALSLISGEGRSTNWIPYLGIDFDATHGMEIAIGWTGTWRADMRMEDVFRFSAGIGEDTHFKMLPGERFQMPFTVIYERDGKTVEEGLVEFHRFVIKHKAPRDSKGELFRPLLPLTASGGNKTDANMLMILNKATTAFKDIPFDTFWVDAGWYGNDKDVPQDTNCGPFWWKNAGNWHPNPNIHPDGNLMKVATAAGRKGMKFLLWFEPERAMVNSPIVKEHPEYFIRPKNAPDDCIYLINFKNPDAVAWMKAEVFRNIEESGVQIYRQDFNVNPLQIWMDNDEEDRKGITEIYHINGLWDYWEALHKRYPDMLLESCAGGGTRIDIHMMTYAHSYCRDDAHMFDHPEELTQNITINTTPYLPFTGGETFKVPVFDTYCFLSCLGSTAVFTPTDFQGMFLSREPSEKEIAWFDRMLRVVDRVRHYYLGDFYALTTYALDGSDIYAGYQLDLPDSGEGFFMLFRREKCPDDTFNLRLRGIDPQATYSVEDFDGGTCLMEGSQLATQMLKFAEPRSYKLVFYKKI
ncbi:MAG: alpha-galactosidase [Bacteroidales bacterium]|nr:alpha-galactosidase [Bacteroidales bacterium]